ncbi:hypothetical protein [Tautonia rosea]|uniref:hypothetical protein n=1 Tax=Tautonia rosea TaxID=2728037 RepID=UPI001475F763|nr:hypothetical protein [Tautonia rosea]
MSIVPLLFSLGMLGTSAPQGAPAQGEVITARYEIDLLGRSRVVFALPPGPRTIQAFRWMPASDSSEIWKSARLRLIWDGDDLERAGVDVPLGRFVSPGDGDDPPTEFENRRAMPYRRNGRLVLDAEGPVRGSLRLQTAPEASKLDNQGYLRAQLSAEPSEDEQSPSSNSGNFSENPVSGSGRAVRYWYDREPGPSATHGSG